MKKIFSASVALLLFSVLHAQLFQNTYDLTADDYANKSVINANSEIISVGSSSFAGAGDYDAMLMKVDSLGNFIWQKQYGGSGTEYGTVFTPVSNGFAIASFSTSFSGGNRDILLIKTDLNGDLQWAKTYGGTNEEYATSFSATSDGGFIITGETKSYGRGGQDAFLLKTDASGIVDWFKTYGNNSDQFAYYVLQTADGGYAVAGLSSVSGQNDAWFFKTDSVGNIQQQFLAGSPAHEEARRLIVRNNKWIIGGNTGNDIFVGQFNPQSFTFDWLNTYGGSNNDVFTDIIFSPDDGNYVVSGFTTSFGSTQDGLIFVVDTLGRSAFSFVLEGSASETIQSVLIADSKGIATGFSNSFGGAQTDVYLTKIGQGIPCFAQQVGIKVTPVTPAIQGPNISNISDSTITTVTAVQVTLTQSSASATTTVVCNILDAHAGSDAGICDATGGQRQIGGAPTATGGTPPYNYAWSPAGSLDNSGIANPTATVTATTTFTVTVTDNAGATSTESITIFVGSYPGVATSATDATCFMNNDGTAAVAGSGGTPPYSYEWSNGMLTDTITGLTAGTYYVTVTDIIGCNVNDSVSVSQPTFVSTSSESTASSGNDGTATVHAHGGTPPYTYEWDTNPIQTDSTATGLAPGNYNVTVRDDNGCSDVERNITVASNPQALSAHAGSDATVCDTAQIQIGGNPSASGGTGPYTYSWSPAAGLDDVAAANPTSSADATTTYTLVVTDNAGATASDQVTITVDTCVGIRNIERTPMNLFPNPAVDILNISIFSDGFSGGTLAIIGIDGKLFVERELNLSGGMNSIILNTKELNPGLYYVRIKSTGFLSVHKVIIE